MSRGALNNGVSRGRDRRVLLQLGVYCPAVRVVPPVAGRVGGWGVAPRGGGEAFDVRRRLSTISNKKK